MAEALLAVWESRQNNMHGQIIRQNVGKKQGGNAYEGKNETKQLAQSAYCAGNGAGNASCHEPDGVFAAEPGISITGTTADSSGTGWSYVKSTKTLTLNGYNVSYIYANGMTTLNLVLEGSNTITGAISDGTGAYCGICCDNVNLNLSGSGSLGIVSWNNGVTISGGTVTADTASSALWLADMTGSQKTGLVRITGNANVSLTSTGDKALLVHGDESTSSTRVHQINLTSCGSVTVKSTSTEETNYAFPVQGYFNFGSGTKITEGSLRSTEDGTNAGGGKLFVADNTTKQVVVAYGGVTKLDKPTNLVWDGTTAKWDAITGADKYRVILYVSTSGSGGSTPIFNSYIAANSKDFSEYMLPGMYYSFEVAAYNSANQSATFSGFAYCDRKQMPGSIGTVTGFAWSGNTISWTAVTGATGYDVWGT